MAAYGIVANLALVIAVFTGIAQESSRLPAPDNAAEMIRRCWTGTGVCRGLAVILAVSVYSGQPIFRSDYTYIQQRGNQALIPIARSGIRLYFTGFLFAGINILAAAFLSALCSPIGFIITVVREEPPSCQWCWFFQEYSE